MIYWLVSRSIMRQDKSQIYWTICGFDRKVPFRTSGIFDFAYTDRFLVLKKNLKNDKMVNLLDRYEGHTRRQSVSHELGLDGGDGEWRYI